MNYGKVTSLIIKKRRNDLGFKAEYIAKVCNISNAYYSQIENGLKELSQENPILASIFKALKIEMNNDSYWLKQYEYKIQALNSSNLEYDVPLRESSFQSLSEEEEKIQFSVLCLKYLTAKYGYLCLTQRDTQESERLFAQLQDYTAMMEAYDIDLFNYYSAISYKIKNDLLKSEEIFKTLIKNGVQSKLIPSIYYQLGQIACRKNDLLTSYSYFSQALTLFSSKGQIRRCIHSLAQMAMTLTQNKNFEEADIKYQELIRLAENTQLSSTEASVLYCNASLNAIYAEDYNKSLAYVIHEDNNNNKNIAYYFNKAWSLYCLNQYDQLIQFLNSIARQDIEDSTIWDCLQYIRYLIEDESKIENILLKIAKAIEIDGDYDIIYFFYNRLIAYYENHHQYKNALKYAKKLLSS